MLRHAALSLAALLPSAACVLLNPAFDETETGVTTQSTGASTSATATEPTTTDTPSGTTTGSTDPTDPTEPTEPTGPTGPTTTLTTTDSAGTSSTGVTASESDSDSDSGTTGVAGVCGDGSLDPGEECDDGNLDDGDACSAMCHIEPTGIVLGEESTTEKAGTGDLIVYGTCNSVFVGLEGRLDNESWHCEPAYTCATPELGPNTSVLWTNNKLKGPYGDSCFPPSVKWQRPCPQGHALVGSSGRVGSVFDMIRPRCAPVLITEGPDGFSISTGEVVELEAIGSDGGDPYGPHDCPENSVAVGASLRAGSRLEALRFTCAALDLSYD